MTLKERYACVTGIFSREMPSPKTELHYDSPFHLLLAVILSAQCTDKRVNTVTPALFERFPDPASLAASSEEEVKTLISSITYPNAKSRHLIKAARTLVGRFDSKMPSDIDNLMSLPGVGRKTANVMLAVAWDKAAMPVDTHVFRVANRLGLTPGAKTPLATEKKLVAHIPPEVLADAHHWLILHGRYVCKARRPDCGSCYLSSCCAYFTKQAKAAAASARKKTDKTKP